MTFQFADLFQSGRSLCFLFSRMCNRASKKTRKKSAGGSGVCVWHPQPPEGGVVVSLDCVVSGVSMSVIPASVLVTGSVFVVGS